MMRSRVTNMVLVAYLALTQQFQYMFCLKTLKLKHCLVTNSVRFVIQGLFQTHPNSSLNCPLKIMYLQYSFY